MPDLPNNLNLLLFMDPDDALIADLGKGNHPAELNFGDCFAYALAEATVSPFCSRAGLRAYRYRGRMTPRGAFSPMVERAAR